MFGCFGCFGIFCIMSRFEPSRYKLPFGLLDSPFCGVVCFWGLRTVLSGGERSSVWFVVLNADLLRSEPDFLRQAWVLCGLGRMLDLGLSVFGVVFVSCSCVVLAAR